MLNDKNGKTAMAATIGFGQPYPVAEAIEIPSAGFPAFKPIFVALGDVDLNAFSKQESALKSISVGTSTSIGTSDPRLGPVAARAIKAFVSRVGAVGGNPRTSTQKPALDSPSKSSSHLTMDFGTYSQLFVERFLNDDPKSIPLQGVSANQLCWENTVCHAIRELHMPDVPVGILMDLLTLISMQIESCFGVAIHDVSIENHSEAVLSLLKSLKASVIALVIMNTEKINRSLVSDDVLEKILMLVKVHATRTIAPIFDISLRPKAGGPNDSYWLSSSKTFTLICRTLCELLQQLYRFITREVCSECQILSVINFSYVLLRCPRQADSKTSVIPLLVGCFMHYPNLRDVVIEQVSTMICDPELLRKSGSYDSAVNVQVPVALALLYIQCTAGIYIDRPQAVSIGDPSPTELVRKYAVIPYEESQRHCRTLIIAILKISFKPGNAISDSRAILNGFVDNVLLCLFHPLWPAAELTLNALLLSLRSSLSKESCSNIRVLAVEMFGHILSRLQSHVASVGNDVQMMRPRTTQFNPLGNVVNDAEEKVACECGRGALQEELMLDCDDCHQWFHGNCVQIIAEKIPESWICASCSLRRHIEAQRAKMVSLLQLGKISEGDSSVELSEDDLLYQIAVNFLTVKQSGRDVQLARQFVLAQWASNHLPSSSANGLDIFCLQFDPNQLPPSWDLYNEASSMTALVHVLRIFRIISYRHSLLHDQDNLLKVLINALTDKQPTMRSRVIKAISSVVHINVQILEREYVMRAISAAVQDRASSVREAAVELLGKKMLSRLVLAEQYYPVIVARLRDKGLSVRKRCVKILRDICISLPGHSKYTEICANLISRSNDELSIRTMVLQAFQQMWFLDYIKVCSRRNGPELGEIIFTNCFTRMTQRIVEVVAFLPSTDWLSNLIFSMLSSSDNSDADVDGSSLMLVCSDICTCIIQDMISLEISAKILHHVRTLHVFCIARPVLLSPHLVTLQPCLKQSSSAQGNDQTRVSLICSILFMSLPVAPSLRPRFLTNLLTDLKDLVMRQSTVVLLTAMPCLCVLSQHMNMDAVPRQLLSSFLSYLSKYRSEHVFTDVIRRSLIRSLLSVGLLVRYFEFERRNDDSLDTDAIVEIYHDFYKCSDPLVCKIAIQGLVFVFSRNPGLILKAYPMIQAAISTETPYQIQAQTLRSLADFLQSEDDHLQYLQESKSCTDKRRISGVLSFSSIPRKSDLQADSGAVLGVFQNLLPLLLRLAVSDRPEVRSGFLSVSRLLIQQRFVNPNRCIPSLIALCTDTEEEIVEGALSQLNLLSTSFPDMVRNGAIDGIKLVFSFQKHLRPQPLDLFNGEYPDGLLRFFTLYQKVSINTPVFLLGILHLSGMDGSVTFSDRERNPLPVDFVATMLAGMPFQNDSPLHLIFHLNRIIGTSAAVIDSYLHPRFKAATEGLPDKDSLDLIRLYCKEADKVVVLLLLKKYLQDAFAIVNARLEDWNPHNKTGIVCVRKENAPHFVAPPIVSISSSESLSNLQARYLHFRELSANDTTQLKLEYAPKQRGKRRASSGIANSTIIDVSNANALHNENRNVPAERDTSRQNGGDDSEGDSSFEAPPLTRKTSRSNKRRRLTN